MRSDKRTALAKGRHASSHFSVSITPRVTSHRGASAAITPSVCSGGTPAISRTSPFGSLRSSIPSTPVAHMRPLASSTSSSATTSSIDSTGSIVGR